MLSRRWEDPREIIGQIINKPDETRSESIGAILLLNIITQEVLRIVCLPRLLQSVIEM